MTDDRFITRLLQPNDEAYDEARALWNGMIDKRPAVIARCSTSADVIEALNYARENGLRVAARGGGHGVAGNALNDGGLVVDLSPMKAIEVDVSAKTVRAEPGVTLGESDAATQAHGLATPLGVVSQTGIAGLTLGGGIGWLRRKHGLAADNVLSFEVVTADGRLVTAGESENADLYWGLRGGGAGLGVVTSFEYRLYDLGPEVMFAFVLYAGERTADVLRFLGDYMATAPDEVSPLAVLGRVPHAADFPAEAHGRPYLALLALFAGPVDEGERALAPLRGLGEPIADFSGPMPYTEAQTVLDADYPDGWFYYWKSANLERLDDDAIDRLVARNEAAPSHHSTIDIWYHGGAMGRVDPEATAFGERPPYLIGVEANWEERSNADANIAWARATVDDLEPYSTGGAYLNFPGLFEEGEQLRRASHGDRNYDRLVALRKEYDPSGLFALS
jgi:FAD/FMN-containing dehydrogenase